MIVDDKPAVTLSPASGLNTFHESHTTADYGTIRMFLPACLQLFSFIRSRQAYEIQALARLLFRKSL